MEVISESSLDYIELKSESRYSIPPKFLDTSLTVLISSSSDSLPELLTDMECIKLNSSGESTPSPSSTSDKQHSTRRSSRPSTSAVTKALDEQLHKIKRRTIAKPRRLDPATLAADVSEKLIEKLYTNKKLNKVKPTNLETIFEEPKQTNNQKVTYVSATKFRRAITFNNHLVTNKAKVQARRKRIKRLLGTSHKLKKVSMDVFMEHLKALAEPPGDDEPNL